MSGANKTRSGGGARAVSIHAPNPDGVQTACSSRSIPARISVVTLESRAIFIQWSFLDGNYTKSARGILQRLSDVRKGLHHERARFSAGMGQGESWVVRALVSKGYEIDVDRAGSVADSADASLRVFDRVHQV